MWISGNTHTSYTYCSLLTRALVKRAVLLGVGKVGSLPPHVVVILVALEADHSLASKLGHNPSCPLVSTDLITPLISRRVRYLPDFDEKP